MSDEGNIDQITVDSFGSEWAQFDQMELSADEHFLLWDKYFRIFPWAALPDCAEGFDMGSGSGRWAQLVAPRVGHLHCIEPAEDAMAVTRCALANADNVSFHATPADAAPLAAASQDFGYSLGVLHHIPDTAAALSDCTALLKPGAPFLLYLYYRFENRPAWFRAIWKTSELMRGIISSLSEGRKSRITDVIAALVYWPLARFSGLVKRLGGNPTNIPLSFYREASFYTMRTDARDRFGTPLEQRFTRAEIVEMMQAAGLTDIRFSDNEPFWVAVGVKQP